MRRGAWSRSCRLASLLGAVLAGPLSASASEPDIAGLGTRSPALAGAGTALLSGYDAVYVNPAGIYGTPRRLTLGMIYGGYQVDLDGAPRPIDNTGGLLIGAGLPIPLGGVLRDRLALGFGFYLPFGVINRARAPFPDVAWPSLIDSRTQVVSILIGAGARLPHGFSVGLSVLALAALVGETRIAADAAGRIGAASQSQLTVHYAPIVGLRWQGQAALPVQLGLVYRAASLSTFRNTVRSNLGDSIPVELPTIQIQGTGQFDPHQIAAEVMVRPVASVALLLNLTWKHWSAYPRPIENATAGAPVLPSPDYHDTVVPRAAIEWQPAGLAPERLVVRGGYFFEWSPAPADETGRTLLDASRHVICFGLGHRLPLKVPLRLDAFVQWHQLAHSERLGGGFALGGATLGVDL